MGIAALSGQSSGNKAKELTFKQVVATGKTVNANVIIEDSGGTAQPLTRASVTDPTAGTTLGAGIAGSPYYPINKGFYWTETLYLLPNASYSYASSILSLVDVGSVTPKILSNAVFTTKYVNSKDGVSIVKLDDNNGILFYCPNNETKLNYRFFKIVNNNIVLGTEVKLTISASWTSTGAYVIDAKKIDNGDLIIFVSIGNIVGWVGAFTVDQVAKSVTLKTGSKTVGGGHMGMMHLMTSAYPVRVMIVGQSGSSGISMACTVDIDSTGLVTVNASLQISGYTNAGCYQASYKINSTTVMLVSSEWNASTSGYQLAINMLIISGTNVTKSPSGTQGYFLGIAQTVILSPIVKLSTGGNYALFYYASGSMYMAVFTTLALVSTTANTMASCQFIDIGAVAGNLIPVISFDTIIKLFRGSISENTLSPTTHQVFKTPNGVSIKSGTAGQIIEFQRNGMVKGFNNLSIGKEYRYGDSGIIGLTGFYLLGVAISSMEILLSKSFLPVSYSNQLGKIAKIYSLSGTCTVGQVVQLNLDGTISNLPHSGTIIGVYQGDGKVILKGISNIHSGLTPNTNYYYDANGVISTTNTGTFLGIAISSTELLIPGYLY